MILQTHRAKIIAAMTDPVLHPPLLAYHNAAEYDLDMISYLRDGDNPESWRVRAKDGRVGAIDETTVEKRLAVTGDVQVVEDETMRKIQIDFAGRKGGDPVNIQARTYTDKTTSAKGSRRSGWRIQGETSEGQFSMKLTLIREGGGRRRHITRIDRAGTFFTRSRDEVVEFSYTATPPRKGSTIWRGTWTFTIGEGSERYSFAERFLLTDSTPRLMHHREVMGKNNNSDFGEYHYSQQYKKPGAQWEIMNLF